MAPQGSSINPPNTSRLYVAYSLLSRLGNKAYVQDGSAAPIARFVVSWMQWEGMKPNANNPLATTMKVPGSTPLPGNPHGVQQLPGLDDALTLYVKNLTTNPIYVAYRAQLVAGNVDGAATALQNSGWCGGPRAPCPGYGAKVLATAKGYGQGENPKWLAAAMTPAGTQGVSTPPGDVFGVAETVGNIADATGLTGFLDTVGGIATWLLDPTNWRRAGLVSGGLLLGLVGVALIKHDTLGQAAKTITKAVALKGAG